MKIIVTGSLGNISKPLAKALVAHGHSVIVISSNSEKQKDIESIGALAAIGAIEDIDFLTAVFTGADAAYCMIPPNFSETDQVGYYRRIGNSYATAIKQSGIKRIVHLSSYGAHLDKGTGFILGSYNVEGILNSLTDISITHLRPGYFYNNLFAYVGMIKGMGLMGANYGGEDKLMMVHPTDIAMAAAEELQITTSDSGVVYVASDDLTCNEVAGILGAAIGKPDLRWLTFSDEQSKEGMEKRGMPAHLISNFIDLGAGIHSGIMRADYDLQTPAVMGKTKLTDFAKEFAEAFNNF